MAIGGSPPNAPREKDGTHGTAGRYGFVAEVLRGYLGVLWLARDPSDTTERGTVLVRHLAPIHTASARSAILEAARWGHATGGSTLEIIEGRNSVDLVTPFLDAEPLRSLLRTAALKHVPLDPAVLLGIAREVLGQLGLVHEAAQADKSPHGFGGLQPDSILVGTNGRVQLIDAGVSAAASSREPWKSDVQRIGYFAPEQIDIRGVVDARSDLFALGIVLWEAFGNRRLFPGADGKSARERVQKGAIPRLDATRTTTSAGLATPIADLVARALERDPAKRFQTAEEMHAAVSALEPAGAARIGVWVTDLADTAIAKRRQLLARSSVAPIAARESLLPGARPAVPAGAARVGAPVAAPVPMRASVPPGPPRPQEPPPPSAPPPASPPVSQVGKTAPEPAPEPASETPKPPAERPAPGDAPPSTEPEPVEVSQPPPPDSSVPTTQPSASASSDVAPSAEEPNDGTDADAVDVTDDDMDVPPSSRPNVAAHSRRPSPLAIRPPTLPQDAAIGDTSLLGAPAEPLAGPMRTVSQLTTLTSPSAPRRRGLFLAIGGALILGVGVGGWFMGRLKGPKHAPKPSLEAHVESVTAAATPSASAEPPPPPPPSAETSAAVPPSAEPAAPPPPSAETSSGAPPSADPSATPPSARGTAPSSPASTASRRPPPLPSRGPTNSGYKPGGI
jgi:serine/threonine protein kinase